MFQKTPELNEEERNYAVDYCQSKNQYYVSPDEGIPWSDKERRQRELGYYHVSPLTAFAYTHPRRLVGAGDTLPPSHAILPAQPPLELHEHS